MTNNTENHTILTHDKTLNIYQRLLLCMQDLRYLQRDNEKTDKVLFSSVSHDKVTRVCSDTFIKYGIYPRLEIVKEGLESVTVQKYDKFKKQEYTVSEYVATVGAYYHLTNIDNPSEVVVVNAYGQGQDNQDKAFGKAISYACKYALLKGLGIETGDDPDKDADNNKSIISKQTKAQPLPETFVLDGQSMSKEMFMGELSEAISRLESQDDLANYEQLKERNKNEINKFRKFYTSHATVLANQFKEKQKTLTFIAQRKPSEGIMLNDILGEIDNDNS